MMFTIIDAINWDKNWWWAAKFLPGEPFYWVWLFWRDPSWLLWIITENPPSTAQPISEVAEKWLYILLKIQARSIFEATSRTQHFETGGKSHTETAKRSHPYRCTSILQNQEFVCAPVHTNFVGFFFSLFICLHRQHFRVSSIFCWCPCILIVFPHISHVALEDETVKWMSTLECPDEERNLCCTMLNG